MFINFLTELQTLPAEVLSPTGMSMAIQTAT